MTTRELDTLAQNNSWLRCLLYKAMLVVATYQRVVDYMPQSVFRYSSRKNKQIAEIDVIGELKISALICSGNY